jgi:hypothetical protein
LGFIETTNSLGKPVLQGISIEYHHMFITQSMQRTMGLPNWLVNNSLNVWRMNTIQHSVLDSYRFSFLRAGIKSQVDLFKPKYNLFFKY